MVLVLQIVLCVGHHEHSHELAVDNGSAHTHCTQSADSGCQPVNHHHDHEHDADHACMICWTIAATAAIVLPLLLALIVVNVRVAIRPRLSDHPGRTRHIYGHLGARGPPVPATA